VWLEGGDELAPPAYAEAEAERTAEEQEAEGERTADEQEAEAGSDA
jgi:hypothetical protein